jgi:flavin reductase (DIM6/NTAB) family NADH-FMN oxidoreductase RutF
VTVSSEDFKAALSSWPSGVTVVTTLDGTQHRAITVSAFASVSLTPPLVLVSINNDSLVLPSIVSSKVFSINILALGQTDVSKACAYHDREGMGDVQYTVGANGCALVDGALVHIACELHATVPAGDHHLAIGLVTHAFTSPSAPLLYWSRQYGEFTPRK